MHRALGAEEARESLHLLFHIMRTKFERIAVPFGIFENDFVEVISRRSADSAA